MKLARQSNIELLRLVCMFFIVIHHIIIHALPLAPSFSREVMFNAILIDMFDSLVLCAVPVFVLISGYFGINAKVKGLLNFYIQCAFYSGLLYLIYLLVTGLPINRWCIYNTLFPITNNADLWFVECYFMLYLISPLLNKCIDHLSKREFQLGLFVLIAVNLYYGWYLQRPSSNINGLNLYNFVFLYFIGRYIAKHVDLSNIRKIRIGSICTFVLGSALLGLLPYINAQLGLLPDWSPILEYRAYNHPLLLVNSIALLLLFLTIHFESRSINWLAASAFSIYLIHENSYIRDWWYELAANIIDIPGTPIRWLLIPVIAILIMLICLLVDKVRMLITNPLVNYATKKINSHYPNI